MLQKGISPMQGIAAQPIDFCYNCNTSCRVAANNPGACRYHPGTPRLDPTADAWGKKDTEYPVDALLSRWLYPGGFKYDCSGQPEQDNGCFVSVHVPMSVGLSSRHMQPEVSQRNYH
ncbi:hypothetical protein F4818DRAFT_414673 [Hypoxylon cercidicola]|nr:hypothetical protein F4818DRAFT_414673 [Hypoxylon cercidicola]